MPKTKVNTEVKLKQYVSQYGEKVFSTDGTVLYCQLCSVKVAAEKKFTVEQHVNREKHKRGLHRLQEEKNKQQLFLGQCSSNHSQFYEDLCEAFISANIPLSKLSNVKLREFMEKYSGKNLPDSSTLRKNYVHRCYEKTMTNIRQAVDGKKIWVSMDETTDSMGRFVTNVVIGTMEKEGPGSTFLLNSECLEKVNYSTICKLFDKSMNLLWPSEIKHDNVLLFVTDAAPYMVKAGKSLRALYSKMVHLTCLAHACHRVAEEVRSQFPMVDQLIGNVKKVFVKAPSRVASFKSMAPGIPMPPAPILTRWGTWIEACVYYSEHFNCVKEVVDSFDSGDAVSIRIAQKLFSDPEIEGKLCYIRSNFGFLSSAITSLEASGVKLIEQLALVKKVVNKLDDVPGHVGSTVNEKIKNVLNKNVGYAIMCSISKVLSGEQFSLETIDSDLQTSDIVYFKYAPIVSVAVERTFSMYKTLLVDNRQSFNFESLHKVFIVHCNAAN